jgi:hypothetical protein
MKYIAFFSLLLLGLPLSAAPWYEEMKFGPAWSNTFQDFYQGKPRTAAYKGILIDLGARKSIGWTSTHEWLAAALNGQEVDA